MGKIGIWGARFGSNHNFINRKPVPKTKTAKAAYTMGTKIR
jgi:hypothetical protein